MDRISICELAEWRAAGRAFTLIDVRRAQVRAADGADVPGALWRDPTQLLAWKDAVPRDRRSSSARTATRSARAPPRRCARWGSMRAT